MFFADDVVRSVVVPPGRWVRVGTDEGNGTGAGSCECPGRSTNLGPELAGRVSFVEVIDPWAGWF